MLKKVNFIATQCNLTFFPTFVQNTTSCHEFSSIMIIPFSKFHGTGNDFIIIDNRSGQYSLSSETIENLCNRHTGIGADGLIMLELTDQGNYFMRYYNSDGKIATMCGNGGRCIASFAVMSGITENSFDFLAGDGWHHSKIQVLENGLFYVSLTMNDVKEYKKLTDGYYIHTGTPHFVQFRHYPDSYDINVDGSRIRYDDRFKPDGVNVNFISLSDDVIQVRTYEKGVENETLSCGTGVTAAALVSMLETGSKNKKHLIRTKGGSLSVEADFDGKLFTNIILHGPAQFVFSGKIKISS